MNKRFNQDSDASDTDAQQGSQPTPASSDRSGQIDEASGTEAPQDGDDIQTNPVIINR